MRTGLVATGTTLPGLTRRGERSDLAGLGDAVILAAFLMVKSNLCVCQIQHRLAPAKL